MKLSKPSEIIGRLDVFISVQRLKLKYLKGLQSAGLWSRRQSRRILPYLPIGGDGLIVRFGI